MTRGLGTLRFLEWRRLVQRFCAIRRSPGRAALWTLGAIAVGFFVVARIRAAQHAQRFDAIDPRITAVAGGTFALFVGAMLAGSRRKTVGAFESLAEARFIALSDVSPLLVLLWLQVRTSLSIVLRTILSIAFFLFTVSPNDQTGGATARYMLSLLAATYFLAALPLPVALSRAPMTAVYRGIAACALALGAYTIVRAALPFLFAETAVARFAEASPASPLAPAAADVLHGGWTGLIVLAILALGTTMLTVTVARDAYPELYEMTLGGIERISLRRGNSGSVFARARERLNAQLKSSRSPRVVTRGHTTLPRGAWILVWRGWLLFRRSRPLMRSVLGLLGWYALAATLGFAFERGNQGFRVTLIGAGAGSISLAIVFSAFFAQTVALDLGKPLFWLVGSSTLARLVALVTGSVWRAVLTLGGAGAILLVVAGAPTLAVAAPIVAATLVVLLQTTGYAIYALFPARIDQNGPLAIVRIFLALVSTIVPALVAAAVAFGALALHVHVPAVALALIGATVAAIEGSLFLLFASWRIDSTLDAFTRVEA